MTLNDEHYSFIDKSLKLYGVQSDELRQDLVDHISTYIENHEGDNFETLFEQALQKFEGYANFKHLQLETQLQKFASGRLRSKAWLYSLSCIAISLTLLGGLFKIMHWPGASVMLCVGILILFAGSIPLFFFGKYQEAKHELS